MACQPVGIGGSECPAANSGGGGCLSGTGGGGAAAGGGGGGDRWPAGIGGGGGCLAGTGGSEAADGSDAAFLFSRVAISIRWGTTTDGMEETRRDTNGTGRVVGTRENGGSEGRGREELAPRNFSLCRTADPAEETMRPSAVSCVYRGLGKGACIVSSR